MGRPLKMTGRKYEESLAAAEDGYREIMAVAADTLEHPDRPKRLWARAMGRILSVALQGGIAAGELREIYETDKRRGGNR